MLRVTAGVAFINMQREKDSPTGNPRLLKDDACAPAGDTLACFHCGRASGPDGVIRMALLGEERSFCCHGCAAAAGLIAGAGLGDFYRLGRGAVPAAAGADQYQYWRAYDHPDMQREYVSTSGGDEDEIALRVEGMTCPACAWLIEKYLSCLHGVREVLVNYTRRLARIRYDRRAVTPSRLLTRLHELGYRGEPALPGWERRRMERERRALLRRLGVAAAFGMQVMMVAWGFYFSGGTPEREQVRLMQGLNLLLTLPVVLYSAQAFYRPAWRSLALGALSMDVNVSLAIVLAYAGSAWAVARGAGDTYFDSVVMFVTLLLVARYFDFSARRRAALHLEHLQERRPALATRLTPAGDEWRTETLAASSLRGGDRILVPPGEILPVDGTVCEGASRVDEALLTGESLPVAKRTGDPVYAGTVNREGALHVNVTGLGATTVLAHIIRAAERAHSDRPRMTLLADRWASWFALAVLVAALAAGLFWSQLPGGRAFPVVLSVLAVSCPCALSLATPAAYACAIDACLRRGLLVARGRALEILARATHFIFDKTGTLSGGALQVVELRQLSPLSRQECLRLAAGLETGSEHPVARAILRATGDDRRELAADLINHPGLGVEGTIAGRRWFIGSLELIRRHVRIIPWQLTGEIESGRPDMAVYLADAERVHGLFVLREAPRAGAAGAVGALRRQGLRTVMLSGDRRPAAAAMGAELGLDEVHAGCSPEGKLRFLDRLRAGRRAVTVMVGDGVNDAPVLAAADVSIAMAAGSALAQSHADVVLMNDHLEALAFLRALAVRTRRIIRQNLSWAVAYNLLALPAAVAGWVPPWLAALGMSCSSMLVVGNALRLLKTPDAEAR